MITPSDQKEIFKIYKSLNELKMILVEIDTKIMSEIILREAYDIIEH